MLENSRLLPRGGLPQNNPFRLKNDILSGASDFDDFSQMLDIIALNDLALVLCTKKILVPPWRWHFAQKNVKKSPL